MWIPQRVRIAVDMIVKTFDFKEGRVIQILDIGCGEGTLGKLLKERLNDKVSIIGCDISDAALKEASSHYSALFQIDVEGGELTDTLDDRKFDCIVILEVLEHLFEPGNVLKQCCGMIHDNGILIASFPNIVWYGNRIDILKGRFPRDYLLRPGEHIQNFTLRSFAELMQGSGFLPVEIDGQFVFPRIFRPARFFAPIFKKFPNLFGYQIAVKAKKYNS